jgi:hypothetical protein
MEQVTELVGERHCDEHMRLFSRIVANLSKGLRSLHAKAVPKPSLVSFYATPRQLVFKELAEPFSPAPIELNYLHHSQPRRVLAHSHRLDEPC